MNVLVSMVLIRFVQQLFTDVKSLFVSHVVNVVCNQYLHLLMLLILSATSSVTNVKIINVC